MLPTTTPTSQKDESGSAGKARAKKAVSMSLNKKSKPPLDDWEDMAPPRVSTKDLRKLRTCVPFYLEKNGIIVNDLQDDNLSCTDSSSLLSDTYGSVPSDDLLSPADLEEMPPVQETMSRSTSVQKYPLVVEHNLTMDELQTGLSAMMRTKNGFTFNFSHLNLSNLGLLEISLAGRLSHLRSIDISINYIQDVNVLGSMPYLQIINASRNEIEVFGDFRAPVALQQVNFSRNKIFKIVNLDKFWGVTEVNLSHNYLTNADGFEQCPHLRVLDLSHNRITYIDNFNCPNLVALFLHKNKLENIFNLSKCQSLRALSLAHNQIQNLGPLRYVVKLQELWLQNNKIMDIQELAQLKPLLSLFTLIIEPNPFNSLGLWRKMVVFTLSQLMVLDGTPITPQESVDAINTFKPSFWKISHENRTAVLLDKACQSANTMIDENIHSRDSLPPVLLLVGAPMSNSFTLATLLKDRFRSKIQLGGVHSTATTLEFPNTTKDIPVSYESFLNLKRRGEFLAYSHILGRICGFATSQIARAAERNAVLVASVPLGIALTLKQWKIKTKTVLVMCSERIEVTNEQRDMTQVIKETNRQNGDSDQTTTDSDEMRSRFWSQDVDRHTKQAIGFFQKEELFDTALEGDKKPSFAPVTGKIILKNKDKPDMPLMPMDFASPSEETNAQIIEIIPETPPTAEQKKESPPLVAPDPEASTFEAKRMESRLHVNPDNMMVPLPKSYDFDSSSSDDLDEEETAVSSAPKKSRSKKSKQSSAQPNGKKYEISFYSSYTEDIAIGSTSRPNTSCSKSGKSHSQETPAICTDPPFEKFVTPEHTKASPFSAVQQLQRLRRIASLFMEAGEKCQLSKEMPNLASRADLVTSIDWKHALIELQAQELQAVDNAYTLLINRFGEEHLTGAKTKDFFNLCLQPAIEKIRSAQTGDYELVFLKKDPLPYNLPEPTCVSRYKHPLICENVEGRIVVEQLPDIKSPPASVVVETVPSAEIPKRGNSAEMGKSEPLESKQSLIFVQPPKASLQSETTSQGAFLAPGEPDKDKVACSTVINPNFGFGPHDVCCKEPEKKCLHPICCTLKEDRGTFYKGDLQVNFLETLPPSLISAIGSPPQSSELWFEEWELEGEGMETTTGILQQSRPSKLSTSGSLMSTEQCMPQLPRIRRSTNDRYDEMPGEGDPIQTLMHAAPPPSQNSCSPKSGTSERKQSIGRELPLELDDDKPHAHTLRRHKETTRAAILHVRDSYIQFHQDNPGFFSLLVQSETIDCCLDTLSDIVNGMLEESAKFKPARVITYAGENFLDSPKFIKERMHKYKLLSEQFSKGNPPPYMIPPPNCKKAPTQVNFEPSRCPDNLFYPFPQRRPKITKIRKLIQS